MSDVDQKIEQAKIIMNENVAGNVDPEDKDLFDLVQPSGISPNLDILLGGTIPPNPTELVARDTLEKAIEQLKSRYDYVLLDTAPIGMVTDTAIISRVADMCVYVCRADVTPKAAFCYINVLRDEHKFDKLAVVINGIGLLGFRLVLGRYSLLLPALSFPSHAE